MKALRISISLILLTFFFSSANFADDPLPRSGSDSSRLLPPETKTASFLVLHQKTNISVPLTANKPADATDLETIYKVCPAGLTPKIHFSLAHLNTAASYCNLGVACVMRPIEMNVEVVNFGSAYKIKGYVYSYADDTGGAPHQIPAQVNYTVYCEA